MLSKFIDGFNKIEDSGTLSGSLFLIDLGNPLVYVFESSWVLFFFLFFSFLEDQQARPGGSREQKVHHSDLGNRDQ